MEATMANAAELVKRYGYGYGNSCYNNRYGYNNSYGCSSWGRWGRWVLLGCILLFAIAVFFLFSCISARRRRKLGHQPYRGTGWATFGNHGPVTYNQQRPQQEQQYYNNNSNAPPAYNQPQMGQTGSGAANDYYGGRNDVELQQPGATYGGYNSGAQTYQPPVGKPH